MFTATTELTVAMHDKPSAPPEDLEHAPMIDATGDYIASDEVVLSARPSLPRRWQGVLGLGVCAVVLLSLFVLIVVSMAESTATSDTPATSNDRDLARKVVLISLDGFRWDYLDALHVNASTPAFARLRGELGAWQAAAMRPIFPSKTFPNHYSLVTGLYAESHGIVGNDFWDPVLDETFDIGAATAHDSRFWLGEPVWNTVERQGRTSGVCFWPGSDVVIGGKRPTRYRHYDGSFPPEERVDLVLQWIDKFHDDFTALYFSDVDTAGHRYGPAAPEVGHAIEAVDSYIGRLLDGLEERDLLNRTNIIITSDHGMTEMSSSRQVFLDDYVELEDVRVVVTYPVLQLWPRNDTHRATLLTQLAAVPHVTAFAKDDVPDRLHYHHSERIAPIGGVVDLGWVLTTRNNPESSSTFGAHGFDNQEPDMGAFFLAAGPHFKPGGGTFPEFQNVDLYELLCDIMQVEPAPNNGTLESFRDTLS